MTPYTKTFNLFLLFILYKNVYFIMNLYVNKTALAVSSAIALVKFVLLIQC